MMSPSVCPLLVYVYEGGSIVVDL